MVRAEVDTFYGRFPLELEFVAYLDGRLEGVYSFIGYEGKIEGTLEDSGVFSVSGIFDSYAGAIEFRVDGRFSGRQLEGSGVTGKNGRFSVSGTTDGSF